MLGIWNFTGAWGLEFGASERGSLAFAADLEPSDRIPNFEMRCAGEEGQTRLLPRQIAERVSCTMHSFRVWAPRPKQIVIQVNGNRFPMERVEGGWLAATVEAAGPGSDYGFVLDSEGPFPDPRSRWQPAGVHSVSRLTDPGALRWTDAGFAAPALSAAVFYELHVGAFTPAGTFDAAIERLDHLLSLGVTHVELMPVNAFPGKHGWGYDGVGLFAVHQPYGGPEGLKRFVNACHGRGLAVVLDVVYNHLGPSGNYLGKFAPYFNDHYRTPWGEALNFDGPESDEVRRFFCDNALMWLRDYHIDGLRLDAVHAILDTSAVPFLEQLAREIKRLESELRRPLVLIAESDLNDPRLVRAPEQCGFGLHAQWSDDFHHALHTVLTGERSGYYRDFGTVADLAKALTQAYVYDGRYSEYRRRRHGRPPRASAAIVFWVTCRITTRSAIAPAANASDKLWMLPGLKSAPRWCSRRHLCRCFSWAKNGAPRRRFSISPITRSRSWRRLCAKGGGRSLPPSAGRPNRCLIQRRTKPSRIRGSSGRKSRNRRTPGCLPGIGG